MLVATRKLDHNPTFTFVSSSTTNSRFSTRKSLVVDPSAAFTTLGMEKEMSVPPPPAAFVLMSKPVAGFVAKTGPLDGTTNT